jgi:WD40 repeat protein/serine/threonine protein kinase
MNNTTPNVKSLFGRALDIPSLAERAAYLDQACNGNVPLRAAVDGLLQAHDQAGSFLKEPDPAAAVTAAAATPVEGTGTRIGPYKLLQQIGEGGMGTVYMAEQEQPLRRRVALKIIKPGMDSAQVIARFEVERQALALMDHQNIARVLDAGATDSGRPYFVMELVHGVPITQYCNANKLSPRQRLELFIPVCQAIQHAHQKGIIHRDLKPSNVMVTLHDGQPVPKVIDFGVAKATEQRLTERTLFTQYGTIVGTLEYMAPEQAEMSGLGVDTRSDIYALGVLLYELLTGTTPLERGRLREAAYDEMLRLIREEEPPRPSRRISTSGDRLATISAERNTEPAQLSRLVHGELDWIVMRCLEKDRTRRYEAASSLARDIQRYLADEPVEACPPSAGYKLRKFARKNKKLLATVAAFTALLLLGVTASTWQAVRATQAETVAQEKEQQATANAVQAQEKEQEANQQRNEAQQRRDEVQTLNEKLQATQDQLRSALYAAHINLAQQAWEKGGVVRMVELLERHRPKTGETELRGFEWYYLYRLCHAELLTLGTNSHSVAYSSDGKRLASAGGQVQVWDAQTGQELLSLKGGTVQGDWGNCVAFSPDDKRLASTDGRTVKVWDVQTGQELLVLKGHSHGVGTVAFSPDGKRLASGGWVGQNVEGTGRGGPPLGREVKVWDAQTGQELLTIKGEMHDLINVVFSPDGKRLASGSKVWDVQTGRKLLDLKVTGNARVAYSPDGKRLASGDDRGMVQVWDAQTGQEILTIKGTSRVYGLAFSPDGKRLASSSNDDRTVQVWDAQTGQELLTIRGTGRVWGVAFSPDGKRLVSSGETLRVWNAQTDQKPLTLKMNDSQAVASVAFSPDGKRLASASWDQTVKVSDTQTGKELLTLKVDNTQRIVCVAYSPDGKRLASQSKDSQGLTVKVWDAQTGQELLSFKYGTSHSGRNRSLAFSPDGKRLATTGGMRNVNGSGYVKVSDAQTGQELLTLKGMNSVLSVAFSPDGKRLASGSDEGAKVWDAQSGQELLTIKGFTSTVQRVAFSPDGKRLVGVSFGGVKVWDAQTSQELLALKGHTGSITGIAFSPDGMRLVSAADDKTVKVWDAHTGQELLTVEGHSRGDNGVAFSPDGHRLACGAAGGTVKIYDATPLPAKP